MLSFLRRAETAGNSTGRQGGSERQASSKTQKKLLTQALKENIEMRGTQTILAVVALAAVFGLTSAANAQGVKFVGVGSSAMFNATAVGAFSDVCSTRAGSDCHHYSISGKNTGDNQNFAQAFDSRNSGIPVEGGTLWVIWDNNTSPISIWAYLSVDSVVGNRCFFANPRCSLQVDSGVLTTPGQN
jgi:hypothetical protein